MRRPQAMLRPGGLEDAREARTPYLILPKGDSKAAYEMIRKAAASIGVEIPPAE